MDGVVRSPSLFSITRGLPPSMIATHELVVPRSIPMTLLMALNLLRNFFVQQSGFKTGGQVQDRPSAAVSADRRAVIKGRSPPICVISGRSRDDYTRRTQQAAIELIALLHHLGH